MKMQARAAAFCLAAALGLMPCAARCESAATPAPTVSERPAAAASPSPKQETADAETPSLGPALIRCGLAMLDHCVYYPQLAGLEDADLLQDVNQRIMAAGQIEALLNRMPMVLTSPTALTADYTALLQQDVLSVAMSAQGPVYDGRPTHVWGCVNIDLATGADITLDDLFIDPAAAREAIESYLEEELAPSLSAHLLNSQLTPLPEQFYLTAQGLTLCYPIAQLSTLSGCAGAVNLQWYELPELDLAEGSVLDRIGAAQSLALDEASPARIAECVEAGALPGVPAVLGGSMQEATDAFRMLIDPDLCEAGRMFSLEDAAFRDIYLLTDALTQRTWEHSVIQGIRADRINLYGLCTGVTRRTDWLAVLGEPSMSVALTGDRAEAWRLPDGVSDYYIYGEHRLRLHANEEGVLVSLFILP